MTLQNTVNERIAVGFCAERHSVEWRMEELTLHVWPELTNAPSSLSPQQAMFAREGRRSCGANDPSQGSGERIDFISDEEGVYEPILIRIYPPIYPLLSQG